jgi:hypothetical protein
LLRLVQLVLFGSNRRKKKARAKSRRPRRAPILISDPMLTSIWGSLAASYFPDRTDLLSYVVRWSTRRQKRVLGSCNITKRVISVARELNAAEHHVWLEPLLYHEMCHAVLERSVSRRGRKILWHGPEFKALERQHPGIGAMDAWIKGGGWRSAVLSSRARMHWEARRATRKASLAVEAKAS